MLETRHYLLIGLEQDEYSPVLLLPGSRQSFLIDPKEVAEPSAFSGENLLVFLQAEG